MLRGKADRIDLLEDNTFRIIDYKLSRAPERKHALQLPIYAVCTVQHLQKTRGQQWDPGQAGYIAFGQDRQFSPMLGRGMDKEATLARRAGEIARRGGQDRARRISADPRRHHDVRPLRPCRRLPEGLRWRRLTGCRSTSRGVGCARPPTIGRCVRSPIVDLPDAAARSRAVDPAHNVVLEASAGTGKTHVLVDRYLNLLSHGVDPANILAITFTRKAAAEMRGRILSELRKRADAEGPG